MPNTALFSLPNHSLAAPIISLPSTHRMSSC